MVAAFFWGGLAGFALVVGAVAGLVWKRPSQRAIGLIMAFGAGTLISALAFELTEEAFLRGGLDQVAEGLAVGAVLFFAGDWLIEQGGGEHRKRSGGEQEGAPALAIVLGAILDGIPESIVIGASLVVGGAVSLPVVVAVFLSNVPESLSAATGLRKAGFTGRFVIVLWIAVTLVSGLAAAAGNGLLGGMTGEPLAFIQALAAGAILTMLADTMMPEAFEHGGGLVGLLTVLGFALAFTLSRLD